MTYLQFWCIVCLVYRSSSLSNWLVTSSSIGEMLHHWLGECDGSYFDGDAGKLII
jgi:hypothetical protein